MMILLNVILPNGNVFLMMVEFRQFRQFKKSHYTNSSTLELKHQFIQRKNQRETEACKEKLL